MLISDYSQCKNEAVNAYPTLLINLHIHSFIHILSER